MKKALLLSFFVVSEICTSPIYKDLEGCWLPESYVLALNAKSPDANRYLSPVQNFQIFESDAKRFAKDFRSEIGAAKIDDFILVATLKSDMNGFSIVKVRDNGETKYRLLNFYNGLNLESMDKSELSFYQNAVVTLSRSGEKMLFEAVNNGEIKRIYFVKRFGNHVFKTFEEAKNVLSNR